MKIVNVGRSAHNEIIVNDTQVSRTHVQITQDDAGNISLKDLGSRNGTYVNGQRVTAYQLQPNDIIRVGNEVLPWRNYFTESIVQKTNSEVKYAGFWLRFLAWFIDILIIGFFVFITNVIITVLALVGSGEAIALSILLSFITIILQWLYFSLFESSTSQATLGKMALAIKVTDLDGSRISFGQATGRYFGKIISYIILGFGYYMAGWTEKKQALHDIMARTLVVKSIS